MGVREAIDRNRTATMGIAVALLAVTMIAIWLSRRAPDPLGNPNNAFFSIDDGQKWFVDDSGKLPPFDHEGKPAYRAYVFTCDGGKTAWVAYLERYTTTGKTQIQSVDRQAAQALMMSPGIREIKRPGTDKWIDATDMEQRAAVINTKCPHGGQHAVTALQP